MADLAIFQEAHIPKGAKQAPRKTLLHGQAPKDKRDVSGLLSVIGNDGRIRETETTLTPWRMICALKITTTAGQAYVGTGWMIGPSTVLTAGHNIMGRSQGQTYEAREITVIPGRDAQTAPFGSIRLGRDRMDVHRDWADRFDPARDVGVLHLPGETGRETGWFALAAAPDAVLEGRLVNVAGYPGWMYPDTPDEYWAGGDELWWHRDALAGLSPRRIHYVSDTTGGQSGGPVWSYTDQGGAPIGVGIHAYGAPSRGGQATHGSNAATRIDPPLAELIDGWLRKSLLLQAADGDGLEAQGSHPRPASPPLSRPVAHLSVPPVTGGNEGTPDEADVMRMLADPSVPMELIRPYIRETPDLSEPFKPRFELAVPPPPGELRPEGAFLLDSLNAMVRAKRQWTYRSEARKRPNDLRLVSDGDSWMLHPLVAETWNHLFPDHLVFSLDGAGDLVSDISRARQALEHMRRIDAHGVILSGGGNDMLSDGALADMLKPGSGDDATAYFDPAKFDEKLRQILLDFRTYIAAIRNADPQAHVFLHGYDYARPMGGKWLAGPMQGIVPAHVQPRVVALFIDRFNEAMIDMAASFGGHVHHIDNRGAAPHPWHDEIHPDAVGFSVVAARFSHVIEEALKPAIPGTEIAGAVSQGTVDTPRGSNPELARDLPPLAPHLLQPVTPKEELRARRRYVARMAEAGRELDVSGPDAPRQAERVVLDHLPMTEATAHPAPVQEVILSEPDFVAARFLRDGAARAQAVCRIRRRDRATGTGTLLAGGYVLTNWHVLQSAEVAATAEAEFGFEENGQMHSVALQPDQFFISDQARDFAICACDTEGLEHVSPVRLPLSSPGVSKGSRVNIIQHPRGRPKEVAFRDNKVLRVLSGTLEYRTDTEGGSSGSAVFDDTWRMVGLHRAGLAGAFNQAIRIEAIASYLETQLASLGPNALPGIRDFLGDPAPELGFFGRMGAFSTDENGDPAPEVELPGFSGDGNFADIGFWNIRDFFSDPSQARVDRVAEQLIAMNMDAMGLSEVSRASIERTVTLMRAKGENADFVFLDAGRARDLAIIYDRDTTTVTPMVEVSARHSDALAAKIEGKEVFPRKPLIARVVVGTTSFAMLVVHLKSKRDRNAALAARRRRAAAETLRLIVEDIREVEGLPVAVGGDFNEDLTTDVLSGLTDAPDHLTLTANDQANGAISYVGHSHRSLIDHVIISDDLEVADIAGDDLAIVRFDRSVADFIDVLSDHVPLVIRIVMRDRPEKRDPLPAGADRHSVPIPENVDRLVLSFD